MKSSADHKWVRVLIPVQCLIILVLCSIIIYKTKNPVSVPIDLKSCKSEFSSFTNNEFYFDETIINTDSWTDALITDNISLKAGSYTLYIDYECNSDKMFAIYDGTGTNAYIENDMGYLRSENKHEMFKFKTKVPLDSLNIRVKYEPFGYLKIKGMSVVSNIESLKLAFVVILILFILIDIVYIKRDSVTNNRNTILAVTGIIFISSLPLFLPQIADGHDLEFALLRIEGDYLELKNGTFPVRMQSLWLRGGGYPVSIFYGDIFMYFPAVLRMVGFSVVNAWKAYILAINAATAIIGYLCFRDMTGSQKIALIMSCAYSTAPYRLTNIYVRAAGGEFTSMTFYPVIALALYRIYTDDLDRQKMHKYSTLLALGISAILCTHLLSTEMLGYVLILMTVMLFRKTFSAGVFKTLLLSIGKTLFISAYYVIPFLDYYFTVPTAISETVSGSAKTIQYVGAYISDFFSFDHYIDFNGRLPFTPGIILIVGLIAAIATAVLKKTDRITLFLSFMSILLLYVSSNLFPWDRLAFHTTIGRILAQIQLPTRFVGLAIIFLTCLLGHVIKNLIDMKKISLLLYAILIMTIISVSLFTDNYEKARRVTPYTNTSSINTLSVGRGEYVRVGTNPEDDNTRITHEINKGYILDMTGRGTSLTLTCSNTTAEDHEIILPRYNYKYYHLYNESGIEYTIRDGINNLMAFTLPAGYQGNIYLKYIEPWYWRVSEFLSLLTIVYLAAVQLRKKM